MHVGPVATAESVFFPPIVERIYFFSKSGEAPAQGMPARESTKGVHRKLALATKGTVRGSNGQPISRLSLLGGRPKNREKRTLRTCHSKSKTSSILFRKYTAPKSCPSGEKWVIFRDSICLFRVFRCSPVSADKVVSVANWRWNAEIFSGVIQY